MPRLAIALQFVLLTLFALIAPAQSQKTVSQVTIDSIGGGWFGNRGTHNRHLIVAKDGDRYFATGDNVDKAPVDPALVASLAAAVSAPFRDRP